MTTRDDLIKRYNAVECIVAFMSQKNATDYWGRPISKDQFNEWWKRRCEALKAIADYDREFGPHPASKPTEGVHGQ